MAEARPITLVVAPAGYGKTTLLSAWLRDSPRPLAWLSLDPHDNDPSTFLAYLIAAIRSVAPEACGLTQSLAARNDSTPTPWPFLARCLVRDVEAIEHPLTLVLDDYHVISQPDCHAFVAELLRHRPPSLHLVIASRRAPPLPLAKPRAEGALIELGTMDLRWSHAAAAAFLLRATDLRIDRLTARHIAAQADGWVAGLRLAALALSHSWDPAAGAEALAGRLTSRPALEYLASEVLERQPPEVKDLLLRSAILDRFCDELCVALLEDAGSGSRGRARLDHVERENLFLIPLEDSADLGRPWYRFHVLFRQLLLEHLAAVHPPETIAALHRRAAGWLGAQGLIEEALRHLLAAGDEAALVHLIETNRHTAINRERWPELERWLRLLPESLVDRHAELVLAQAWTWLNQFRWEDLTGRIEQAAVLLDTDGFDASRHYLRAEVDSTARPPPPSQPRHDTGHGVRGPGARGHAHGAFGGPQRRPGLPERWLLRPG